MARIELVETGLTADRFVNKRSGEPEASERALAGSRPDPRQLSAYDSLPSGDKGIADRLSVRGLNFVNALVEMNGGHAVDVRFLEIEPNRVVVEGWGRPGASLIHYHLICECSEQAHVRSGSRRHPLNAGDLFRMIHENQPAILHGGEAGSLILVVTLKLPEASRERAIESPPDASATEFTPSNQAMRWGAAS